MIRIYRNKWGDAWKKTDEWMSYYQMGIIPSLDQSSDAYNDFTVFDKKKFLLSVIKFGIEYEELI